MPACFNILGGIMTYIKEKFYLKKTVSQPASQTISDSYVEITGSNCYVDPKLSTNKLVYKFSFYVRNLSTADILHVKLQKSNDEFSSNIVDVEGANFNIKNDGPAGEYSLSQVSTTMFTIDSFSIPHSLRLVCRNYDSTKTVGTHKTVHFDGINPDNKFYNTSLVVFEV